MSSSTSNLGTFIARIVDGMVLVATMDHMEQEYALHAKKILKTLKPNSPARCTIEAGQYYYQSAMPPRQDERCGSRRVLG